MGYLPRQPTARAIVSRNFWGSTSYKIKKKCVVGPVAVVKHGLVIAQPFVSSKAANWAAAAAWKAGMAAPTIQDMGAHSGECMRPCLLQDACVLYSLGNWGAGPAGILFILILQRNQNYFQGMALLLFYPPATPYLPGADVLWAAAMLLSGRRGHWGGVWGVGSGQFPAARRGMAKQSFSY